MKNVLEQSYIKLLTYSHLLNRMFLKRVLEQYLKKTFMFNLYKKVFMRNVLETHSLKHIP